MSSPCDLADDFFDGELSPPQADDYREHATTCARCQRALTTRAQLRALEVQYRPELEAKLKARAYAAAVAPQPSSTRWRWGTGGAAITLAAILLLGLVWSRVFDRTAEKDSPPALTYRIPDGRSASPRGRQYLPRRQGLLGAFDHQKLPADATLREMENASDPLSRAAAHLARGSADRAREALDELENAGESADVLSERAFAHLNLSKAAPDDYEVAQGHAEEALRLADRALAREPAHGPALWNRALALEALGLRLLAARAFDMEAALGESGWSDEARDRADALRALAERDRRSWEAAIEAGEELVANGAPPGREVLSVPVFRHYFYEAVRSRSSRPEVEQLRPLAQELDALAGDTESTLEKYVSGVTSRNFAIRGPLAAEYRRLAMKDPSVDAAALFERLRRADQADIALGVLRKWSKPVVRVGELDALISKVMGDAWLTTRARLLKAEVLRREEDSEGARAVLGEALASCGRAHTIDLCVEAQLAISLSFDRASLFEQADDHARNGLRFASLARAWGRQGQLVLELAQLARHREDVPVSRAYYEEALEMAGPDRNSAPNQRRYVHEGLANLSVKVLDFDEARRHIDAALQTGLPLGVPGALALADISRLKPEAERDAAAMEAFQENLPQLERGARVLAEHAIGRWLLGRNRQLGAAKLRSVIELAKAGEVAAEPDAQRALAYSYTSLIIDAGERGDAGEAIRLLEEEWRHTARSALAERCMLGVTADDERVVAIVRDAGGSPSVAVAHDLGRREPLRSHLQGLLSPSALERLSACARVEVIARAPIYGRPGLLPREIAWSYRSATAVRDTELPVGPQRHLVVQQVSLAPRHRLETPVAWIIPEIQGEPLETVSGQGANPLHVSRRMEDATAITLIVHGKVTSASREAYLVLAPRSDGVDVLLASDIEQATLRGRPLVVLVSCQGARPAPVLHEARSLPAAFLKAGARAVLAATDNVPDRDGPEFFSAVRARIRDGAAPAEALRAERAAWYARGRGAAWLDGVLLFD